MELSEITPRLSALIQERILQPGADFNIDTNLFENGLDSMGIMQLILVCEEEFKVMIPESDVITENFITVSALAKLIQNRTQAS